MSTPGSSVAVVGYGLLGEAVAARLSSSGRHVIVCDAEAAACERARHAGYPTLDLETVAGTAPVVIVTVYSAEQLYSVLHDMARPADGKVRATIVSTTLSPAQAAIAAAACNTFVEFPISGTSAQVRDGKGLGLAAPQSSISADVASLLSTVCPDVAYFESVGQPASAKLSINLVLELNRSALAHGLAFAENLGLDTGAFTGLLQRSAAASAVVEAKATKMIERDYRPEGRVEQSLKDCLLIADLAAGDLPLLKAHVGLLRQLVELGLGELDASAVRELLDAPTSIEVV